MDIRLGSYLREGRKAAGITVEEMAQRTRIPRRSIEALEEERFDLLPQLVFVKGFVRSCCREAGIDPAPAFELLVPHKEAEVETPVMTSVEPRSSLYLTPVRLDVQKGLRISHVLLVLAAVIIFVSAYLLAGDRQDGLDASADATPRIPVPAATQPSSPTEANDAGAR